jgi:hypothetical protein
MNSDIDRSNLQRVLNFFGEQAGTADFRKRRMAVSVSLRLDFDQFDP